MYKCGPAIVCAWDWPLPSSESLVCPEDPGVKWWFGLSLDTELRKEGRWFSLLLLLLCEAFCEMNFALSYLRLLETLEELGDFFSHPGCWETLSAPEFLTVPLRKGSVLGSCTLVAISKRVLVVIGIPFLGSISFYRRLACPSPWGYSDTSN